VIKRLIHQHQVTLASRRRATDSPGRSFTDTTTSASPDAPEPMVRGLSAGGESHERTRLGIEIPELAKNQVFRGFGMSTPSPNAVSLENRRGKMTSLRGRPVGLSGLKLSV